MIYEYIPKCVCSKKILIEYNEDKIINVEFKGGCNGNGKGITSLVKGESFSEIIDKLQGITCDFRKTSCPDQLSKALMEILKNVSN